MWLIMFSFCGSGFVLQTPAFFIQTLLSLRSHDCESSKQGLLSAHVHRGSCDDGRCYF